MVRDYNFSRSQSGLLIPNLTTHHEMGNGGMRFMSESSINFTNMSYKDEIELLKGSVFENSIEQSEVTSSMI